MTNATDTDPIGGRTFSFTIPFASQRSVWYASLAMSGCPREQTVETARVQSNMLPLEAMNTIRPFAEADGRGVKDANVVAFAIVTLANLIRSGKFPVTPDSQG